MKRVDVEMQKAVDDFLRTLWSKKRKPINRGKKPRNASPKAAKKWRACRAIVLVRDNFTCKKCGGQGSDVDHIKKRSTHPELRYELTNLQTLCRTCHRKKHEE